MYATLYFLTISHIYKNIISIACCKGCNFGFSYSLQNETLQGYDELQFWFLNPILQQSVLFAHV